MDTRQAIGMMINEHVPHTYCWSPSLVPKPSDWPDYLDVCGFFFLDLATNYQPPEDLLQFLDAGEPPIYIGFGSITGHDSTLLLKMVLDALKKTGYRALLSGLATENDLLPENIFRIGNCPHDWLFQRGKCTFLSIDFIDLFCFLLQYLLFVIMEVLVQQQLVFVLVNRRSLFHFLVINSFGER